MDRIVYNPLKVDFHIHSYFSRFKDDFKTIKNGTINNLNLLVDKLNENKINMCSITDHDYFSFDLYKKLKSFESKGSLKKVFPGVEFSVGIENEGKQEQIHVIAIFDDSDQNKLKNLEKILSSYLKDDKINYNNGENHFFSEAEIISILNRANLNVVLIAHQKSSINSKYPYKHDISNLGSDYVNKFLTSEVFEALEFKSMKSGLFNKVFADKTNSDYNYDIARFITGSDCHEWSSYPNYDSSKDDSANFKFTFLKCLPTFKGLCMALSDYSRISLSDSLFSKDDKKLNEIEIEINNVPLKIPLSKGINAIIGDNSIGKSLLLHKMNNYSRIGGRSIKDGYEKYLSDKNIKIISRIDEQVYKFDTQGEIRNRFQTNDISNDTNFLNSKYPEPPNQSLYKTQISSQIDNITDNINKKFTYDIEYKSLKTLIMSDKITKSENISVRKLMFNKSLLSEYSKIAKDLNTIKTKIDIISNYDFNAEDIKKIDLVKANISYLLNKYSKLEKDEGRIYTIKTAINIGIQNFDTELKKYKDDNEKVNDAFENGKLSTSETISKLILLKRSISNELINFKTNTKVEIKELVYGDYKFVKRFKGITVLNKDYFESLIAKTLKKDFKIDVDKITEAELSSNLKENKNFERLKPIDKFREMLNEESDKDLEIEDKIFKKDQDASSDLSSGLNYTIYFDIISNDTQQEGMYIIDQPEDDVSQKSIKDNLIKNFKKMSEYRQIILVTHNPQFVVNLDVDNVICLTKNDKSIDIKYGSLEYEDNATNIIELVADNLDGGIESIKKRWKRYGKEISFNKK